MKTDEELASDFSTGSDIAFAALYNRYKQPVYLFALKMLSDADASRDALQAVFLKVFEQRKGLAYVGRVRPWLFTVARNYCLNQMRDRPPRASDSELLASESGDDPLEAAEKESEARIVARALERLSVDQREVLILREYQNLSYEEIAAATGSSESAVKSRLFKARRRLCEILKPVLWKG